MYNVLVTGGAGFIGSNFVRYLLKTDAQVQVLNLDALTYAGSPENLKDLPDATRHTFVKGDIGDQELLVQLLRQHNIDTLVHFAAESHVDRSIFGPGVFVQTNVVGTVNLLEALRSVWLKDGVWQAGVRFHHVSTDEVFGSLGAGAPAWTEDVAYDPHSPYSASKAASDHFVRAYGHTYGLPFTITNCSNNYGPYQFPEKLISVMILNALHGKPLPVYGDGGQIRDWLYVEDHCEAIYYVLCKGKTAETYNIGGGNQPTNLEVVKTLCRVLDRLAPDSPHAPHEQLIQFVKDRPGHDRRYAMDATKLQRELGWSPRFNLEQGLEHTVRWYIEHADWVESIRKQAQYHAWLDKNYKERNK